MERFTFDITGWVGILILMVVIFAIAITFIAVYTNLKIDFLVVSIVFGIFLIYLTYMGTIDTMYGTIGIVICALIVVCVRMEANK